MQCEDPFSFSVAPKGSDGACLSLNIMKSLTIAKGKMSSKSHGIGREKQPQRIFNLGRKRQGITNTLSSLLIF